MFRSVKPRFQNRIFGTVLALRSARTSLAKRADTMDQGRLCAQGSRPIPARDPDIVGEGLPSSWPAMIPTTPPKPRPGGVYQSGTTQAGCVATVS